jgi:hypothetical protein
MIDTVGEIIMHASRKGQDVLLTFSPFGLFARGRYASMSDTAGEFIKYASQKEQEMDLEPNRRKLISG